MAARKYKVGLSQTSLEGLQKELKNLEEALNKNIEASTKKLGKKSLDYMKEQYSLEENNMSNHISNINLKSYNNNYKKGFIISSGNDIVAVFNEFGTGIVGQSSSNPLASSAGYNYNMNSPHKGVIPEGAIKMWGREYCESVNSPDTWWYFKNGKWWHTKGMKAKNMYSSLVDKLNENASDEFKTSISQTIGNYNVKL